jgi:hypothetical protein
MAMVFSEDVLFLHVPKTGGRSVTHFLLRTLKPPIHYVEGGRLGVADLPGYVHIPDAPHRNLKQAREFLGERGIELARFKAIIAVIRNPYDRAVSDYFFQRQERLGWTLIDPRDAPMAKRRRRKNRQLPEVELVLAALAANPNQIARIELGPGDATPFNRDDVHRVASQRGQIITSWTHEGVLFLAPTGPSDPGKARHQANWLDFRSHVLNGTTAGNLYDYYHLDGEMPPNLRLVRFERLADGVREALQGIDTQGEDDFPWLNRSDHAAYETYYDAETEAEVYMRAQWIFDAGLYPRLRVPNLPELGSLSRDQDDTARDRE